MPLGHMQDMQAVTRLLVSLEAGNLHVTDDLFRLIHGELHRIVHQQLEYRQSDQRFSSSAFVREAYLNLVDAKHVRWQERNHFFALSARAMRQILSTYALSAQPQERGVGRQRFTWDEVMANQLDRAEVLLAIDEGLSRLSTVNERMSRVVELRFFGGLKEAEIAHVLGVSARTVRRDWRRAKAWMTRFLEEPDLDPNDSGTL